MRFPVRSFDRRVLIASLAVVGTAVALELVRPFRAGPVGFDVTASVIYFDRIVSGRHLESFVTATPKPLLTLVDGVLMAATHDWRAVSAVVILAFGASVALAAAFIGRATGPVGAIAAAIAVVSCQSLVSDVSIAYGGPTALLLWLVAGLAMQSDRPRPALAGLALAAATLVRLETLAVLGFVVVALAVGELRDRRSKTTSGPNPTSGRRGWLIALGFLAVPVMMLHDALLTGNPFWWASVSATFSELNPAAVLDPVQLVGILVSRYVGEPLLLVLAALGAAHLARRRAVVPLVGLGGLTIGIAAFLLALSVKGVYVSIRYLEGIDLGIALLAAAGASLVATEIASGYRVVVQRWRARWSGIDATVVGAALGLVAIVVATFPPPSLATSARSAARAQTIMARNADRAVGVLACAIGAIPDGLTMPPPSTTLAPTDRAAVRILAPTLLRPRLVHDLGVPLFAVGGSTAADADPSSGVASGAYLIVHDRQGRSGARVRNARSQSPDGDGPGHPHPAACGFSRRSLGRLDRATRRAGRSGDVSRPRLTTFAGSTYIAVCGFRSGRPHRGDVIDSTRAVDAGMAR